MMVLTIGFSQESKTIKPHFVSLYQTVHSEKGFAFKYQSNKLGVQVTGVPMFSKSKRIFFGVGVSGLCTIQETEILDVYGFLGGQYIETDIFEKTNRINMSTGLGLKTKPKKGFGISTRGGYGVLNAFDINMITAFSAEIGLQYSL